MIKNLDREPTNIISEETLANMITKAVETNEADCLIYYIAGSLCVDVNKGDKVECVVLDVDNPEHSPALRLAVAKCYLHTKHDGCAFWNAAKKIVDSAD